MELSFDHWKGFFDAENVLQVLGMERGLGMEWSLLGHRDMQGRLNHLPARCGACKAEVPVAELARLAELGRHTCACGVERTVRAAPDWAQVVFPGARWAVDEHLGGADDGTRGATQPVLMACMGCGGPLRVDGRARVVRCGHCGDENFLPDALWNRLHPVARIQEFFVVCELDARRLARLRAVDDGDDDGELTLLQGALLPPDLLARMSGSGNDALRQGAAAASALPPEAVARLVRDEDWTVRAALAANPALDPPTLATLAADEDNDVREAVAAHPGARPELLARLLGDSDWNVRLAAMKNPRTPTPAIAARAAVEGDRDVLGALRARSDLDVAVLDALARSSDDDARAIAAGHPRTPPEALAFMVETGSGDVRVQIARHPATPADALPRLLERGDDEVLEALAIRPDLPPGLLLHLAREGVVAVAAAARTNPGWHAAHAAATRTRLLIGAAVVLLALGAGAVVLILGRLSLVLR
ncbi:MAG: hypothetical protein ABIO70_32000 [Pseudomonadota bacterium]